MAGSRGAAGGRRVYIVDGARSPILKPGSGPGPFDAADLAVAVGRSLLSRQAFSRSALDALVLGHALPDARSRNLARTVARRLGCEHTSAHTVSRAAGSGLQALDSAAQAIASGRAELALAGGSDAVSYAPHMLSRGMTRFLGAWRGQRSWPERLRLALDFRPALLRPEDSLRASEQDPLPSLGRAQAEEEVAALFGLDRGQLDAYATQSHQRADTAQAGPPPEIEPLFSPDGRYFCVDGFRDSAAQPTLEELEALEPIVDPPYGRLTRGNTAPLGDGAAWLLLASPEAVERHGLSVLGRLEAVSWSSVATEHAPLGAAHAVAALLARRDQTLGEIDCWEIEEHSAVSVLGCLQAWNSADYCRGHFGRETALGELDLARVNAEGGAIACGHAPAAAGLRLVLHLVRAAAAGGARSGIAALACGDGEGGAALIEIDSVGG